MAANKVVYGTLVLMDLTKDTVTADQMPQGCTAHDKTGNQITGNVTRASWMSLNTSNVTKNDTKVTLSAKMPANRFMEENATMEVSTLATNLGDATASDVVKGKTFTSTAGVKVTGTHTDLDTSDATATAARICEGDTAYVKGSKVTGTLPYIAKTKDKAIASDVVLETDDNVVLSTYIGNLGVHADNPPFAMLGDNTLTVSSPKSNFGDATAADVTKGKTFTSSVGVKVSGTLAEGTPTASYDNTREMSWRQIDSSIVGKINLIDIPVNINAGDVPVVVSGKIATTISPAAVNFGNATAADVAKGKTFTSNAGVVLTGTASTSGSSSGGIDTSDATATANDLPYGVTAYAKGNKITGSLNQIKSGASNILTDLTPSVSNNNLRLNYQRDKDIVMRAGSWQIIDCALSSLGDATAADVAKGKTFTSSAGLRLTGTATSSSGGSTTQNAAFGSVTPGSDGSCTINTGLSSVSKFTLVYDGAASSTTTGCYAIYYSDGTVHGLGWYKGIYGFSMTPSSVAPDVSISGGTITIAAGTNATKLAAHAYMWSASV